MLPAPALDIRQQYDQLTRGLSGQIERLAERLEQIGWCLHCRPGCADCCVAFSVFPLEAAIIAARAADLVAGLTAAQPAPAPDVCVLLENGRCRIYPFRPIICRSQGLPLAYVDEERQSVEVSACLINFPEGTEFTMEELLFLDEINRRLAALNIAYCRDHRLDAGRRLPLAEIF